VKPRTSDMLVHIWFRGTHKVMLTAIVKGDHEFS